MLVGGQPIGLVLDVPHDIKITAEKNLLLITSSLGGTFPGGLPIGKVNSLRKVAWSFQNGQSYFTIRFAKVSEVTILRSDKNVYGINK